MSGSGSHMASLTVLKALPLQSTASATMLASIGKHGHIFILALGILALGSSDSSIAALFTVIFRLTKFGSAAVVDNAAAYGYETVVSSTLVFFA